MISKVICIDDSAKPNEISSKHWIKKGEKYTIVKMCISKLTNDKYFVLEEVKPDNPLYGGYNIKRFGVDIDDLEELVKEKQLELEEVE
jgi:hypothetical protein